MKILFILFTCTFFLHANVQLSSNTYKKLSTIQKLNEKKQYTKALNTIEKLLKKKLSKADRAYILQSQAFIYLSKENYKKAIVSFKKMNALKVMSKEIYLNSIYNIAQLNVSLKEYKEAIKYLNIWISKTPLVKPQVYILLAQSYTLTNQIKKAINSAKQAVSKQLTLKREVPISWYELLFTNYFTIKDYKQSIQTLQILINIKPLKKDYWLYLSQIYTINKQQQKGINIFEQAYNLNILNNKDIIQFTNFLLQNKLYYKGAKILSEHIKDKTIQANEKNLHLLFSAYFNAKEYSSSLKLLEKLINLTHKDKYILEKARILNMMHKSKKAIKTYELLLKNTKFKEYPLANLEASYLYYENEQIAKCKVCLQKAKKYKITKKLANDFLQQL